MHLTEDDLVLHYYGELDAATSARVGDHLRECGACHTSFTTLQRVLAAVESTPPVDLGEGFERTVWARLQPELEQTRKGWLSWLVLSPGRLAWVAGVAILVGSAFFAGRMSHQPPDTAVAKNVAPEAGLSERILLADLGTHLDRSQTMLIELVSADPSDQDDFSSERTRAGELAADNRLYRQVALANGNTALAAVLDDLEQVLVDVAASPEKVSAEDLNDVRRRIENKGLLFKVRVMSTEVQRRQKAQIRSRAGQSS